MTTDKQARIRRALGRMEPGDALHEVAAGLGMTSHALGQYARSNGIDYPKQRRGLPAKQCACSKMISTNAQQCAACVLPANRRSLTDAMRLGAQRTRARREGR